MIIKTIVIWIMKIIMMIIKTINDNNEYKDNGYNYNNIYECGRTCALKRKLLLNPQRSKRDLEKKWNSQLLKQTSALEPFVSTVFLFAEQSNIEMLTPNKKVTYLTHAGKGKCGRHGE